jgi:hypothetical protein
VLLRVDDCGSTRWILLGLGSLSLQLGKLATDTGPKYGVSRPETLLHALLVMALAQSCDLL